MLELGKGIDIVAGIGKIATIGEAMTLFEKKTDETHFTRIKRIENRDVLVKIANAVSMCDPDSVYVNTGSEEDRRFIRQLALQKGEEKALPSRENHSIHFDLKEEQGRIIDRTYYIANQGEKISTLANRMERDGALTEIREKMTGIMRGKCMIVGFYIRGPVGSPASNPALEITSSAYVAHSAEILYRNAYGHFDREVDRLKHYYTNIHSEGLNRPEDLPNARVFMDRSHRTTYSFNCTYAGNTLLLKKGNHRFSVDKAIYENRGNELSEHMFITGIEGPGGRVTWFTGAAPSGCGKTTTAMAGDHFVGDDLAQMWRHADGTVRSINPEYGIFGILQDVNPEGDPKLMEVLGNPKSEVIWSNVLVDAKGNTHWVGNGDNPPESGTNFQGKWERGMKDATGKDIPLSHPNSRCTISAQSLSNCSDEIDNPDGVVTRVVTYSGRDGNTMPPVWVAKTPEEGVVIGACIVSAATSAEVGATGVKRAPWANAAFIPGALGSYMDAQFQFFGHKEIAEDQRPLMAGLNYFLTDAARGGTENKLLGEKRDVKAWLAWLERRANREVGAIETPIGFIPTFKDLERLFMEKINKVYTRDLYDKQFSLYIDNIIFRIDLQIEAYGKEIRIPEIFFDVLHQQKKELLALREKHGPIVKPENL